MNTKLWKAGWAVKAQGVLAAAALGLAMATCPFTAQAGPLKKDAPSPAMMADLAIMGIPAASATLLAPDPVESADIAKLIDGYPGAADATIVVYRGIAGSSGYEGVDSGLARWVPAGCRIVMPARAPSLSSLAEFVEIPLAEAAKMGLDQLQALHELGHCQQRMDSVGFDLPGLSRSDSKILSERVFSPIWRVLDQAGLPSRAWAESHADAFMAIERLASTGGDPQSIQALKLLAKARSKNKAGSGSTDAHLGGEAIEMALLSPKKWASLSPVARGREAQKIASISVISALSADGGLDEISDVVSDGQIGRMLIEDAASRWTESHGKDKAYQAVSLDGEGFEPRRQEQADRFEALIAAAKLAVKSSASKVPGFSWTAPKSGPKLEKYVEAQATVAQIAMDSPAFQQALDKFGSQTPDHLLADALLRASTVAAALSDKALADAKPKKTLLANMGSLVNLAVEKTGLGKAKEAAPAQELPKEPAAQSRKSL